MSTKSPWAKLAPKKELFKELLATSTVIAPEEASEESVVYSFKISFKAVTV